MIVLKFDYKHSMKYFVWTVIVIACWVNPLKSWGQEKCQELFAELRLMDGELSLQAGPTYWKILDLDHGFYFYAQLKKKQELHLSIFLVDRANHMRSSLRGAELFDRVMEYFGTENIVTVLGQWRNDSLNFRQFQLAMESGSSSSKAARQTWTAHQAARHGFTRLSSLRVYEIPETLDWLVVGRFLRPRKSQTETKKPTHALDLTQVH